MQNDNGIQELTDAQGHSYIIHCHTKGGTDQALLMYVKAPHAFTLVIMQSLFVLT